VGRLDFASEGLILLTDDGDFAQYLMNPQSRIPRMYRLRLRGEVKPEKLEALKNGITVRGVEYRGLKAGLVSPQTGSNAWVDVTMYEGKNRELRNIFEFGLRLSVSRLIRIGYGPYRLPRSCVAGATMSVDNLFKRWEDSRKKTDKT
jgi:23S rRNA pseudouridine2605 synthase